MTKPRKMSKELKTFFTAMSNADAENPVSIDALFDALDAVPENEKSLLAEAMKIVSPAKSDQTNQ